MAMIRKKLTKGVMDAEISKKISDGLIEFTPADIIKYMKDASPRILVDTMDRMKKESMCRLPTPDVDLSDPSAGDEHDKLMRIVRDYRSEGCSEAEITDVFISELGWDAESAREFVEAAV